MNLEFFSVSDFDCSHTGRNEMDPEFLVQLDELRRRCGFAFIITSGYRDPSHPAEARKESPGFHTEGIAADIRVLNGWQRRKIVEEALKMGYRGIGVAKTFVHVDDRSISDPAVMWTYS